MRVSFSFSSSLAAAATTIIISTILLAVGVIIQCDAETTTATATATGKIRRNYKIGCNNLHHHHHYCQGPHSFLEEFHNNKKIRINTKLQRRAAAKTLCNTKLVPRDLFEKSISSLWITSSTNAIIPTNLMMGNALFSKIVVTTIPRIVEFFVASEGIAKISELWFGDHDKSSNNNVVGSVTNLITTINVLVYLAWHDATSIFRSSSSTASIQQTTDSARGKSNSYNKLRFMCNNFRMPTNDMKELAKRPHTILLSAFSHRSLGHLISNMFALQLVGRYLESSESSSSNTSTTTSTTRRRRRQFAYFYIGSIYASKLINIFILKRLPGPNLKQFLRIPSEATTTAAATSGNNNNGLHWLSQTMTRLLNRIFQFALQIRPGSLGASGAICAVEMLFCLEFPPMLSIFWNNLNAMVTNQINRCCIDERADSDDRHDGDECNQVMNANNNNTTIDNNNNNNNNNNNTRQIVQKIHPGFIRRIFVLENVLIDIFCFDYKKPKNHIVGRCTHLGGYAFGIIFYYARRLFASSSSSAQVPT